MEYVAGTSMVIVGFGARVYFSLLHNILI